MIDLTNEATPTPPVHTGTWVTSKWHDIVWVCEKDCPKCQRQEALRRSDEQDHLMLPR
jgi:hypothetical protein